MRRIAVAVRLLVLGLYGLVIIPLQMLALRFGWPILHRLPMSFHRMFLRLFGVRVIERGSPPGDVPTLVLSNHVSWLDIPVIGSLHPLSFIAKSEVATWPGVGFLATLQRSVFIDRQRRKATAEVNDALAHRLGERRGDRAVRRRHHRRRQPAAAVPLVAGRRRAGGAGRAIPPCASCCNRSPSPIRAAAECRSPAATGPFSPGTATWSWGRISASSCLAARSTWRSPGASRSRSTATARRRPPWRKRRCAQAVMRRYSLQRSNRVKRPSRPRNDSRLAFVKKVFVKSYGCQANVYDAERMTDLLAGEGYDATGVMEEADLVILNTCHIREKAAEKVYSELGRVRDLKAERSANGQETRIVVAGCVAQAEGSEILRRAPSVDVVVGPQNYHHLPDLLRRARKGPWSTRNSRSRTSSITCRSRPGPRSSSRGVSAFLTIQEGCDKFCTFCVVPYTRGTEVSRPVSRLVDEATRLAEAGVRELTPDRPERQRLSRRGTGRHDLDLEPPALSPRGDPRHRPPALHHLASPRHGRCADPHPRRSAGPDALAPSAGAIGIGPRSRGHEPEAHGGRLPPNHRAHPGAPARPRPLVRLHRRLPGRDRCGFRRHHAAGGGCRLCVLVFVQIQPAPGHARRRSGPIRCRRR